jgi:hypothetical protein
MNLENIRNAVRKRLHEKTLHFPFGEGNQHGHLGWVSVGDSVYGHYMRPIPRGIAVDLIRLTESCQPFPLDEPHRRFIKTVIVRLSQREVKKLSATLVAEYQDDDNAAIISGNKTVFMHSLMDYLRD